MTKRSGPLVLSRRRLLTLAGGGTAAVLAGAAGSLWPGQPARAMSELQTDVLIVGASLGGIAAALAVLRMGRQVVITETSDWIGGQLTAQLVPPDEHPWIESTGCTASYRSLRDAIRQYYRQHYPLLPTPAADPTLNPGMATVSRLSHEPRVALAVLENFLAPFLASGQATLLQPYRAMSVATNGDWIQAVTVQNILTGDQTTIQARFVLDGTATSELLPLAGVEHVFGAENHAQTGEPHAVAGEPQPLDQQPFTWCMAVDYLPGEDHTISRPPDYDFWRSFQDTMDLVPQLSWIMRDPVTKQLRNRPLFAGPPDQPTSHDLWHYRRILYRDFYPAGQFASDVTVVNWPQNDYRLAPLLGVGDADQQAALTAARGLSLSLLYWMQTEAPRPDGGCGFPGLRLRPDMTGTADGLAQAPYIRESRRIVAEFTVREQDIGVLARPGQQTAAVFPDSVGIGAYRIDVHPSGARHVSIDLADWPFQIPLGALLPVRVQNLLPASNNLGTTHVTNGCYRVHPVEWNIGEAAGALAGYCLRGYLVPRQVRENPALLAGFQRILTDTFGVPLAWPDAIRTATL